MQKHFLIFITFTLLITFSHSYSPFIFRHLVDQATKDKVCKKAEEKSELPEDLNTLSKYVESLNADTEGQEFIKNLLLEGSTDGLMDFVKQLLVYLVFIILGVIFLICNLLYVIYLFI